MTLLQSIRVHVGAFIAFHKVMFKVIRGTLRRVQERGDHFGGALLMALDEEHRELDDARDKLLEQKKQLIEENKRLTREIHERAQKNKA